jgi:hypothetical protein
MGRLDQPHAGMLLQNHHFSPTSHVPQTDDYGTAARSCRGNGNAPSMVRSRDNFRESQEQHMRLSSRARALGHLTTIPRRPLH